eukprot:CAMPEP_0114547068 /NCGR_PEP_ID=MMETSP0114-20121206/4271_1 /TAXON_ID=31324 /ORGANISM="Goniomonas sp, Strain m" /LENGTH=126 /DNA_ID=CAMNT_0001731607 /DNA_START=828 /DNA_END=1208 /DNA_ORIENTATION=-
MLWAVVLEAGMILPASVLRWGFPPRLLQPFQIMGPWGVMAVELMCRWRRPVAVQAARCVLAAIASMVLTVYLCAEPKFPLTDFLLVTEALCLGVMAFGPLYSLTRTDTCGVAAGLALDTDATIGDS